MYLHVLLAKLPSELRGKFDIAHIWLRFQYTCMYTSRLVHTEVLQGRFDCMMLLDVARYVTDFGKSLGCSDD
jgi:hypothetical protein